VITLFGLPHGIFIYAHPGPGQTLAPVFVEADQDCYVAYTLMGGP
jgi:hypothetical protein